MDIGFLKDERAIRLGAFLAVFIVLAVVEVFAPKRALLTSKPRRWFANLTIVALNPLSVFFLSTHYVYLLDWPFLHPNTIGACSTNWHFLNG